jgi:DNA-directed RNA polymerase specialized sigma subunit
VNVERGGLTAREWQGLQASLPQIRKLAEKLARRLAGTGRTVDELETMAQDFFMERAPRWDPGRESTLYAFARAEVELDVIRAACSGDPGSAQAYRAMGRQEESVTETDVATRWAESIEDKEARAVALGQDQSLAGWQGYWRARAVGNPEEEYARRESMEAMKRAASTEEPRIGELLGLLYEHDLTWDEAASLVQLDKRQAQRLAARAFVRLRVLFGPQVQQAPP